MSARDAAVAPHRAEAGRAARSAGGRAGMAGAFSSAHPLHIRRAFRRTFAERMAERLPNTR
ncbi:hypothetical protein KEX41_25170 [Burkholderia thailandensis]|uniref:hypothetical protein n=1 Tax=Burkholderia thailandensis TaxID=57975 RepID=UPI00016A957D|nr:hypothetical protein [Burkholderia thailandensis]AOJ45041.1 hypothetical protein WJ27_07960 [Burkholderia thailandensis]KVG09105.1 hypothetical protein WJ25_13575 [Burkholderia thailandensis]KVG23717.1 hypothetical protein WJ28_19565 [Burkholderia thailandensis]MBS2131500.1 hypothetical protein [Burkholderia thailandensis]QRA09925.1 hypothetical protein JMY07_11140 [Burkholderia thailandensis]